jgi:hypothetical protein
MAVVSLLVAGCGKSGPSNPAAPAAPWQIKSVQGFREGQHLQVQVTVEATNSTGSPQVVPPEDAALLRPDGKAVPDFRRPFLPQPATVAPAGKATVVLRYSLLEADLAGELSLRWGGLKQPLAATPKPMAAFAEGKWENW